MSHRYHYTAYGLNLESDLPLPGLIPGTGQPEVTIRLDGVISPQESKDGYTFPDRQTACLHWAQVGGLVIRAGQEMVVSPRPDADPGLLGLCIITAGLNMLLHQRGLFLLHASAVGMGKACVALMGRSRSGKSTLALYLQQQGFSLLADDIAAVEFTADQVAIRPGIPQIKLNRDVDEALNGFAAARRESIPAYDKRVYSLPAVAFSLPVACRAVFLLEFADRLAVEALTGLEAFKVLLANSYAGNMHLTRQIDLLQITDRQQDYFRACSRLTAQVPVFTLKRPRQLSELSPTLALIRSVLEGQAAT